MCFVLLILTFPTFSNSLPAQGTAFTYQGWLQNNGSPANGNYDFTFALYDNSSANPLQLAPTLADTNIGVTNGLFTVWLDFGSVFTGNATWLSIAERTNGGTAYVALNLFQELTPTPYAIYAPNAGTAASAKSVAASNIVGTIAAAQLPAGVAMLNGGNAFNGNQTFTSGNVGIGYGASPVPVYLR